MNLQVGVKAFLRNSEGKYLLLRRSSEKYPAADPWDIPGGRINTGALLLDNLQREIREETELSILSDPILLAAQDIIRSSENHIVRLTYFATTAGEPILDTSENTQYQWVALGDILTFPDLDRYVKEIVVSGHLNQFEK